MWNYDHRIDDWLELTEKAFDFVSGAREAFVTGDLDDFIKEVKEYNQIVRKALINGLGLLLNMYTEIINEIDIKIPRKYRDSLQTVYIASSIDFDPPEIEKMEKQHNFNLLIEHGKGEINRDGKVIKEKKVKIKNRNVKLSKDYIVETYKNGNSCIEKIEIKDFKAN